MAIKYPNDEVLNGEESTKELLRFKKRSTNFVNEIDVGVTIAPTIKTTIINETGPGYVSDLMLSLSADANPQNAVVDIYIDGSLIISTTASWIYNRFQGGSEVKFGQSIFVEDYSTTSYCSLVVKLNSMFKSFSVDVTNIDTSENLHTRYIAKIQK